MTLWNNDTSYFTKDDLQGDDRRPTELRFLFRAWEPKEEVRLLTQYTDNLDEFLILSISGDELVVQSRSGTVWSTSRLSLQGLSTEFEYSYLHIAYTWGSPPTGEFSVTLPSDIRIQLGSGPGRKDVTVSTKIQYTSGISFGTQAEFLRAPKKGFQGHLRAVRYNGRNLFPEYIRGNSRVRLVNGELRELAFDNYAVNFRLPSVHKHVGFDLPVETYHFKIRKSAGNAVLIDINGRDFGSVTLVHKDDNYVLIIREYASSPINQTISVVAPPSPTPARRRRRQLERLRNPWTYVGVNINKTLSTATLFIDNVEVANLKLPDAIDLTVRIRALAS